MQLIAQHCCFASCKALLPVLPPLQPTCHATKFHVASCILLGNPSLVISQLSANKMAALGLVKSKRFPCFFRQCCWKKMKKVTVCAIAKCTCETVRVKMVIPELVILLIKLNQVLRLLIRPLIYFFHFLRMNNVLFR